MPMLLHSAGFLAGFVDAYKVVDGLPDEVPPVKYPRDVGQKAKRGRKHPQRVVPQDFDQGRARTASSSGKRVGIKDNVMVAGVPMMNGSATLEGFVPDFDATVVTRLLDAGAEIVGKTHCECFCLSGGSHTNATGECIIPTRWATRPAALPPAAPSWWH